MKLAKYQMRMQYLSPEGKLRDSRQCLIDNENRIRKAMQDKLLGYRHQLGIYLERYRGLSPLEKLNQGYAFVDTAYQKGRLGKWHSRQQITKKISKTSFRSLTSLRKNWKAVTLHWKTLFVYTKKEWSF